MGTGGPAKGSATVKNPSASKTVTAKAATGGSKTLKAPTSSGGKTLSGSQSKKKI